MSLLRNSVEDLRVHVSELKQQADRDRSALARAHKDKVTHMHCTRKRSHTCTAQGCSGTVLCSLYSLYCAGCGAEAAEDRDADR